MSRIGEIKMGKNTERFPVRTLQGYGFRKGQTYINVQDLMLYFLRDIENNPNPEVVKDRRHTVEELRKLMEM